MPKILPSGAAGGVVGAGPKSPPPPAPALAAVLTFAVAVAVAAVLAFAFAFAFARFDLPGPKILLKRPPTALAPPKMLSRIVLLLDPLPLVPVPVAAWHSRL